jgi:uncharacterized membrane protein YczE
MITAFCLLGILLVGAANSFHTRRTAPGADDSFRVFIRARWPRRAFRLSGLFGVPLLATAQAFSPWSALVTFFAIGAAFGVGFFATFPLAGLVSHGRRAPSRHP